MTNPSKTSVNEIISQLKRGELDVPAELANQLVILSASLNTAGNFELDAEIEYAKKWEEIKLSDDSLTDKMTEMKAKQTEEYKSYKQMYIANKTLQEVIRAIKKKLANLETERREGQNY